MTRTILAVLALGGLVAAQEHADPRQKLKEQMENISDLMRESEKWLLEMTRVDRVVASQQEVVDRLQEMLDEPPPPDATAAQLEERARTREELRQQQAEIVRRLNEMLEKQKSSAEMSVQQMLELLRSWPSEQRPSQGRPQDQKPDEEKEREKRLRDRQKEQTQEQPESPREKKDDPHQASERQKEESRRARLKMVEAWIARLPPEERDRIARNDFSRIPTRYRRLIEEYTAMRAKREAEREAVDED